MKPPRLKFHFGASAVFIVALSIGAWLALHRAPPTISATPVLIERTASTSNEHGAQVPVSSSSTVTESPANSASETEDAEYREWVLAIFDSLIRQGDAESLAAAVMLMGRNIGYFRQPSETREAFGRRQFDLVKQAADSAPANLAVQILAFDVCKGLMRRARSGCDAGVYMARLREADPANAVGWVAALAEAAEKNDGEARAMSLQRIANATRVDFYDEDLLSSFTRKVQSQRIAPPKAAAGDGVRAADQLTESGMSGAPMNFAALTRVCKEAASEVETAHCQKIGQWMASRRDDGMTRSAGLTILQQIAVRNSDARAQPANTDPRRYAWQRSNSDRFPRSPEQSRRIMRGDLDALEQHLVENGVPLDPPHDWRR